MDSEKFNLLITTDWHKDTANANLASSMANYSPIDQKVCLGDICNASFYDRPIGFEYWDSTLLCVGNHDEFNGQGNTHANQVSATELYNVFYKPFIKANGSVQNPNTTYWYKDFPNKNIRLIGLDNGLLDVSFQQTMLAWFKNTLEDARVKGMHVIVFRHMGFGNASASTQIWTPFSAYQTNTGANLGHFDIPALWVFDAQLLKAVDDFKANGGVFVCHIHGHRHYTWIGKYPQEHGDQLGVLVPSIKKEWYHRIKRDDNTIAQTGFFTFSIDTAKREILINSCGPKHLTSGGDIGKLLMDYDANIIAFIKE